MSLPKRLIEVDLPIKRISAHARREKSIRHGHISTLHIWWARRPLAACRAVICAALWPDPADEHCPQSFRNEAARLIKEFAQKATSKKGFAETCDPATFAKWVGLSKPGCELDPTDPSHLNVLRFALLDFIADFANWDNSRVPEYLKTSRSLTQVAHETLGGEPGTRPLVVDTFAGGGAIPFEALRVGALPFASDLNPLPVILNKIILEFLPRLGDKLIKQVEQSGKYIRNILERRLNLLYATNAGNQKPFAYLWARVVNCEGPGCTFKYPLLKSFWLKNKGTNFIAIELIPNPNKDGFITEIIQNPNRNAVGRGTSHLGSATCPACGYTMPVERVRAQLSQRNGGTKDAQLIAVCETHSNSVGKFYRSPNEHDFRAFSIVNEMYEKILSKDIDGISLIPNEKLNHLRGFFNVILYGMKDWGSLFSPRQSLLMVELILLIRNEFVNIYKIDHDLAIATVTVLALAAGKVAQYNSSCCRWKSKGETLVDMFGRQALPMVWDFAEAYPFGRTTGDFGIYIENSCDILRHSYFGSVAGTVHQSSATRHPLPDNSYDAFITDPPYYDAIPYADLSDFFYVWLRRILARIYPDLFSEELSPKVDECVVLSHRGAMYLYKDSTYFEHMMTLAMSEGCRITHREGIGIVVFANKSTSGWEAMLSGLVDGGWIITGSWPIDTEMGSRLRAHNSAVLSSSVHIICRPREHIEKSSKTDNSGRWRDILNELPKRLHEWMPRLADEGIVGADAIFACLGPALEIFSRYSSVEKASGEKVTLKEYLEEVWAAVSREALNMIFEGADASGFEEDSRLTAMWLWTLRTSGNGNHIEEGDDPDDFEDHAPAKSLPGYSLEFDAARKIAQGLGAHLENLSHLVEIKGDTATLLSPAARTRYLFGKEEIETPKKKLRKQPKQTSLFDFEKGLKEIEEESKGWGGKLAGKAGSTVLDKLHQSMILFAAGRGEAMKHLLVENGVGRIPLFWRLAQALSALYPAGTEEKRWVDGVLARKKGLGF
ncbi:MAG: DUF1156 domain-containing protein [Thermodesulfobacteriota bacterium]